jgi:hypothetical protein
MSSWIGIGIVVHFLLLITIIGLIIYFYYKENNENKKRQDALEAEIKGRFTGLAIALGAISESAGVANVIRDRIERVIMLKAPPKTTRVKSKNVRKTLL